MTNMLTIAALMVLTLCTEASSQQAPSSLEIKGKVKTRNGLAWIVFNQQKLPTNEFTPIDTALVDENGNFAFTFPEISSGYYQLSFKDDKFKSGQLVLVDSGTYTMTVVIDTSSFAYEGSRVLVSEFNFTGSAENDVMDGYFQISKHYYKGLIFPLEAKIRKLQSAEGEPDKLDSLNTLLKNFKAEMTAKLNAFVLTKMGTSIAVYQTMNTWDNSDVSFMTEVMNRFRKKKAGSFILPHMEAKYQRLIATSLLEQPAPGFELQDVQGMQLNSSTYIGKSFVLLDFWASWCGPCIKEMKGYKEAYKKLAEKGIVIISISTDQKKENWVRALNTFNFPWMNVHDASGATTKKYGIRELPTNFLVDKNGRIVKKNVTLVDLLQLDTK